MTTRRFDVAVIGAGPAGSVAARVLAGGGARVALVDKARFPRDKACGDLVGPRGVRLLDELGLLPDGRRLGDMEVVGPTGRRVLLPASPGRTYPGHALAVPRRELDDGLRRAAVEAGAAPLCGRAAEPSYSVDGHLDGFALEGGTDGGHRVEADVVIGADGALSRVAAASGLVDERAVLWGFALRGYAEERARELPRIAFFEPERGRGYPGYAWQFPGADGRSNVGIGAARRGDRRFAGRVAHDLDSYRSSLPGAPALTGQLGGWLKLGIVGTVPGRGRTLLVGDAAGLVNPLQGEGIAQALTSGRLAADAVLAAGPEGAAAHYVDALARRYASYAGQTAPITAGLLGRPRLVAALGRLLTAPGVGRLLSGAWALYWNDLVDGAPPGRSRSGAAAAARLARLATGWTPVHREIRRSLDPGWEDPRTPPDGTSAPYDASAARRVAARGTAKGGP